MITGTVGAGKTTIGHAAARHLADAGQASGFVDLDGLSRLWPAPLGDPFRVQLTLANIASIADNYLAAGAPSLVLAWVVEDRAQLAELEEAVQRPVTMVRLVAPGPLTDERLRQRHVGPEEEGLSWHLARAPELAAIMDSSDLRAPEVQNTGSVAAAAAAVLAAARW